jgi:AraC-like DNA-binding protein
VTCASREGNMSKRFKSTQAIAGADRPIGLPTTVRADSTQAQAAKHNDALLQSKYRELARKHLGKLLEKLFADFTGLHFHIAWAPTPAREWASQPLPTACSVCCRLSGSPLLPDCGSCGARQLTRTVSADGNGHQFTCRLGVRNYWLALRIRGEAVGIAYLQALNENQGKTAARKLPARPEAQVLSQPEFARATKLLRFMVEHVEATSLADLRESDLASAEHVVTALEKEQARLEECLHRHQSITPHDSQRSRPESHPEQIVHRLIECIEQNYGKPITLRQCACKLGMNAAYLSDLFSHAMGVSFKTRLTELRMTKAKELLSDPTKTASEVAYAVGYASENRFRIAFKRATGLAPKVWRETMQRIPLAATTASALEALGILGFLTPGL